MPKLWSCIAPKNDEEKKREQVNKQINAKLKQDEKIYKATYRLLLLGTCAPLLRSLTAPSFQALASPANPRLLNK